MVVVKKKKGESEDRLITRFKRATLRSGILLEARERKHHKTKSEKKKEKKARIKHLIELEKKRKY